ncbi:MAG: hypothetical protein IJW93_02820 [Clostridia bacterium]|nr:hypothetical protein [Clostridia bacterium]
MRDLFVSFAYYAVGLFVREENPVNATVNELQAWKFGEEIWEPIKLLPYTWEDFQVLWEKYWEVFFTWENFESYLVYLSDLSFYFSRILLILMPLVMVFILQVNRYKEKHCTERNLESEQLKKFKAFQFNRIYPVITWCKDFITFLKENSIYYSTWLVLWCLHFNIFSIFVAFIAYYLYFVTSFDFISLFTQALKLLADLTPIIRFVPGIIWACVGMWIYNQVCRSMAMDKLYHAEDCNNSFLSGRGVVTTVYGEMGIGKTQMITGLALTSEKDQFTRAARIMERKDNMFPNFPWQTFRDEIQKYIDNDTIVDLDTCRKWVRGHRAMFDKISSLEHTTAEGYQKLREKYGLFKKDYTFGYDYTHYKTTYNDELKITHLFDALEDYACAYLIFTVKTTLIFANYSIRVDSILSDVGNMPMRDTDFFNRDPEFQEAYSRHAHIIDFDMLRLGKKILKDNPKARRLSFGTFVITEIDKEFKNMQFLKEMKFKAGETNQKNDLHDACLMMSRHAAVVDNEVFIRIIADLQRPEAWGAGGRELGEVMYISEKSELAPALPFFSPYWFTQGVFAWVKGWWDDFYNDYIVNRSDNTLFVYLFKNVVARINNHYDKVNGMFGIQTMKLEVQSGRLDGEVKKEKWRLITKKDRSRRYRTACLEAVFDSYEPNTMHIDDFIMYAGEVGTDEENQLQNSYFQNDIKEMKKLNASKKEKGKKTEA